MVRVIVILIAVFLLLTVIRNIIRNFQQKGNSNAGRTGNKKSPNLKKKKDSDDDNIVDAKFEELK